MRNAYLDEAMQMRQITGKNFGYCRYKALSRRPAAINDLAFGHKVATYTLVRLHASHYERWMMIMSSTRLPSRTYQGFYSRSRRMYIWSSFSEAEEVLSEGYFAFC